MVCRDSFRLTCNCILITNNRLLHDFMVRSSCRLDMACDMLPAIIINKSTEHARFNTKRGPFLGGSVVRLTTDVVRGAGGTSMLLCKVGADGAIEVVRASGDGGIN